MERRERECGRAEECLVGVDEVVVVWQSGEEVEGRDGGVFR